MKIDYSLYFVTDRNLMSTKTLEEAVEKAILGGSSVVQLREKDSSSRQFYNIALNIKKICSKYNVPLIINDRIDIAQSVDADGVHLGQSDLDITIARKILGNDKIIGISCANYEQAKTAQNLGADYLGIGAMYSTNTKLDADSVSFNELKKIRDEIDIPLVVIGGINKERIKDFKDFQIDGFAVVSAIISQDDIEKAARNIKDEIEKYR